MDDSQYYDEPITAVPSGSDRHTLALPNLLTYGPVLAVPALVLCFYIENSAGRWLSLAVFTIALNWLRNLAGHRFRNDGRELDYFGQLVDSISVIGNPLWTELLFPLGLRYHALHHLFPAIPYHNLGRAHRRLMQVLPADSPYRQTIYPGLWPVLVDLWRSARSHVDRTAGFMAWPAELRRASSRG